LAILEADISSLDDLKMNRIHLVTFESKNGRVLQRTELTSEQSNILKKLNVPHPPKGTKVHLKGCFCSNTPKKRHHSNSLFSQAKSCFVCLRLSNPG